eukprot:scaffold1424_cov168-Amphora_coffeaeformis.AAC.11
MQFTTSSTNTLTKPTRRQATLAVVVVAVLLAVVIAVVLDLALSSVQEIQIKSLTLDTQTLPYVFLELVFQHASWFSTVRPKAIRCHLPAAGPMVVHITSHDNRAYAIQATCQSQDVDAYVAWIRKLLVSSKNNRKVDFACEIDVGVRLGHLMPLQHTVHLSSSNTTISSAQHNDNHTETETDERKKNQEVRLPFIQVKQLSVHDLALALRVELPKSSHQLAPQETRTKLPQLMITAEPEPSQQEGGILTVNSFDGVFHTDSVTLSGDDNESSNLVLFDFTCETPTEDCPWFRPVMDIFLTSSAGGSEPTTIQILVEGKGSFIETLLGRWHRLRVQSEPKLLEDDRRCRRHLLGINTKEQAKANCLRFEDDSGHFDTSLCWLFIPSKGFTVVGDLAVMDLAMSGFGEVAWELRESALKFDLKATAELGNNSEIIDMVGNVLVDWEHNVSAGVTMINTGSWLPFRFDISSEASAVDYLSLILKRSSK